MRDHDERDESVNPGIFRELVNLMASIDSVLEEHLMPLSSKVRQKQNFKTNF